MGVYPTTQESFKGLIEKKLLLRTQSRTRNNSDALSYSTELIQKGGEIAAQIIANRFLLRFQVITYKNLDRLDVDNSLMKKRSSTRELKRKEKFIRKIMVALFASIKMRDCSEYLNLTSRANEQREQVFNILALE